VHDEDLTVHGYAFTTAAVRMIVRDVKEKSSYVALNFNSEMKAATARSDEGKIYERPDGNIITMGSVRFRCPEVLSSTASSARGASRCRTAFAPLRCRVPRPLRGLPPLSREGYEHRWHPHMHVLINLVPSALCTEFASCGSPLSDSDSHLLERLRPLRDEMDPSPPKWTRGNSVHKAEGTS
jgi:hypothetical protein